MKTRSWKILATTNLLALAMFGLTQSAGAQVNYAISGNTAYVTNSPLASGSIVITNNYLGYPVTSIGAGAFDGCSGLTNVMIPDSVTSIGIDVFYGCSSLTSVTIPNSVTSISDGAFDYCGLTSVTIPNSVTNIGIGPFENCSALTNIDVDAANPSYTSAGGVLFNKALTMLVQYPGGLAGSYTIPNSVTSIGQNAFFGCSGLTSVTIDSSVTSIGFGEFEFCSGLTSVTIPSSVTSIGGYAFEFCSGLTNVMIPNSVTDIGGYAFAFSGLTSAYFSGNAPTVNGGPGSADTTVFSGDSGTAYYMSGTTGWGAYFGGWPTAPFNNTTPATDFTFVTNSGAITITGYIGTNSDVIIPSTINGYPVTTIGTNAFYGSSLTSVTITASVTNIVGAPFRAFVLGRSGGGSVTNIAVDAANPSYTSAGGVLFNKTLTTLVEYPDGLAGSYMIPNSVTNIGDYAFEGCSSLTSVTLGNSVTSIGDYAFEGCSGLTSVTIPNSVTSIGAEAFSACSSLTNISVNAANPSYASAGGVLFNKAATLLIQFPNGLGGSYTLPSSVINIGDYAFEYCSGLTTVTIPNNVASIGQYAFDGCSGLMNVTIENGVTSIGDNAFYDCYGLTSVTIPASVTNIAGAPFAALIGRGYTGLMNITVDAANPSYASAGGVLFNKTLTTLVEYPGGLSGSYTIPSSVASIGQEAFEYCSGLTSVTIPNSVTSIGDYAFYHCGLTSVTIPPSVTSIGQYAFNSSSLSQAAYFQGNAPSVNGGPGSANTNVFYFYVGPLGGRGSLGTVYYVPGTTGWSTNYGGWPTAPWYLPLPQILGSGYGLGVGSQGFHFTISWATNAAVVVEVSTNLWNWVPISTNTLVNGTNTFLDPAWTNYPNRFYRVIPQ